MMLANRSTRNTRIGDVHSSRLSLTLRWQEDFQHVAPGAAATIILEF